MKSADDELMEAVRICNKDLEGLKAGDSLPQSVVLRDTVCDAIETLRAALTPPQGESAGGVGTTSSQPTQKGVHRERSPQTS